MIFKSICPIDETQTGTTTPNQSEPGSNGNEGVLVVEGLGKFHILNIKTIIEQWYYKISFDISQFIWKLFVGCFF